MVYGRYISLREIYHDLTGFANRLFRVLTKDGVEEASLCVRFKDRIKFLSLFQLLLSELNISQHLISIMPDASVWRYHTSINLLKAWVPFKIVPSAFANPFAQFLLGRCWNSGWVFSLSGRKNYSGWKSQWKSIIISRKTLSIDHWVLRFHGFAETTPDGTWKVISEWKHEDFL